jgi:hypothetical protein
VAAAARATNRPVKDVLAEALLLTSALERG